MAEARQGAGDEFLLEMQEEEKPFQPFDINEGVDIGDFADVHKDVMPVTHNVRGVIRKASISSNKNRDVKRLRLELILEDGIMVAGEPKYIGKVVFSGMNSLIFWTSAEKAASSDWYRQKKHLLDFKNFCTRGLGASMEEVREALKKSPDDFCQGLLGRSVCFDIKHEEEQDLVEGKYVDSGEFREKITNWKKAQEVQ